MDPLDGAPVKDEGAASGEAPRLRREAGKALSGKVPVVLAVGIALMSGWVLGFGWRGLLCDRECTRQTLVIRRCAHPPLVADPMAPPRLILIKDAADEAAPPAEGQCPGKASVSSAPAAAGRAAEAAPSPAQPSAEGERSSRPAASSR